jgi:hypothetical protein
MERDFDKFPDDENGDILWDIHSRGNDLTERREVDFSVIFPTEEAASFGGRNDGWGFMSSE